MEAIGEEEGIIEVEVEARPEPVEAAVKTMGRTRTPKGRSTAQYLTPKQTRCAAAIIPMVTKLGTVWLRPLVRLSAKSSPEIEGLTSLEEIKILLTTRCFPALAL